jgi:hypothetical protein
LFKGHFLSPRAKPNVTIRSFFIAGCTHHQTQTCDAPSAAAWRGERWRCAVVAAAGCSARAGSRSPAPPSPCHRTRRPTAPAPSPTPATLNTILSRGLFEGKGVSTSRVSPPAPLSTSYGHVGLFEGKARSPSLASTHLERRLFQRVQVEHHGRELPRGARLLVADVPLLLLRRLLCLLVGREGHRGRRRVRPPARTRTPHRRSAGQHPPGCINTHLAMVHTRG